MEKQTFTQAEQKIQEYVNRINSGEEKERILDGLPPSFVRGIEEGLEGSNSKKNERKLADQIELKKIREDLGIEIKKDDILLINMITRACEGKKQAVADLYKRLLDDIDNPESRTTLLQALFGEKYNKYRVADYPVDLQEETIWEEALKDNRIPINNKKPEWMYRGIFSEGINETSTRGSFNVNVTPELIASLDEYILSGKIKANYKFGQPGTGAAPTERHDSISIYFLEEPSEEALRELSEMIKPYVRGDNLLGEKIADGFFMSEIGSIESKYVEDFVIALQTKDSALSDAVKNYTSPKLGSGDSRKMSEAQFYAIKDVVRVFGYDISYSKEKGFEMLVGK